MLEAMDSSAAETAVEVLREALEMGAHAITASDWMMFGGFDWGVRGRGLVLHK